MVGVSHDSACRILMENLGNESALALHIRNIVGGKGRPFWTEFCMWRDVGSPLGARVEAPECHLVQPGLSKATEGPPGHYWAQGDAHHLFWSSGSCRPPGRWWLLYVRATKSEACNPRQAPSFAQLRGNPPAGQRWTTPQAWSAAAINSWGWETRYLLDLSPCSFFLFPKIKESMRGRRFATEEEVNEAYKARHPIALISHAVWCYYRFSLSYRDVEECPPTLSVYTKISLVAATKISAATKFDVQDGIDGLVRRREKCLRGWRFVCWINIHIIKVISWQFGDFWSFLK